MCFKKKVIMKLKIKLMEKDSIHCLEIKISWGNLFHILFVKLLNKILKLQESVNDK
jgi:hypothetical protein